MASGDAVASRLPRRAGALAITAALVATAGAGFQRVFGLAPIALMVGLAAVVPVLVSAVVTGVWRKRPGPLWVTLLVQLAAWSGVVAGTLYRPFLAAGPGALATAAGTGLRDAYRNMLTTILPAPARPELLIGAQVVIWIAAVAAAEIVLRTRTRATPALPAVAAFGVALLLGVDGPGSNLPVAGVFVALVVALMLVRTADGWRPLAAGLPAALAIAAAATAVAPYLPTVGTPYDPRHNVQAPPPQRRDGVNPLDRVSEWLASPGRPLFTVRASAAENWRLAVLDHFDGATWTPSGRFTPSGSRVPETGRHDGTRTTVTQRFTLSGLPGVWLPAADRPRTVTGLPVSVDPASGVVAAARTPRSGQSYRVTSAVPDFTANNLAGAEPARDPAATALPSGAGGQRAPQVPRFQRLAQRATGGASTPFAQAVKLSDYLRKHGVYDVKAPPGHTYRHLDFFLNVTHHGTSEQFGTAFAVLARTLGLPTRVVVGFRPGRQAAGGWQVNSGDVLVWPEVRFRGLGWVPFFPTPERKSSSRRTSSVPVGQSQKKLEQQQKNAESRGRSHRPDKRHKPTPSPHRPPQRAAPASDSPAWWWFAAGGAAAVVVAYLAAVVLVPALRRRRRRRRPNPGDQVLGAWRQTLDDLGDVGLRRSRALTAEEVAAFGDRALGAPARDHLGPLATLVNHTRYAPGGETAAPGTAGAAWGHSDAVGRLVTHTAGRLRRTRRRLHPRSLRPPR